MLFNVLIQILVLGWGSIYQALCVCAPGIMKFLIVLNGVFLFRSDFSWWEDIIVQRCLYTMYVKLKSPQSVLQACF